MARRDDGGELPYLSPVTQPEAPKVTTNEENYDTLKVVYKELQAGIAGLFKDFNAFKLAKGVGKGISGDDVMLQIAARQIAYEMLLPHFEAVKTAIEKVDKDFVRRMEQNARTN